MQKTVYQTDVDGLFLYATTANELALAPGLYNIPFGAYEDAPPAAPAGQVARRTGDAWELVEDYRGVRLWLADSGMLYTIGQEVEVGGESVSYPGWGALPGWLTDAEPAPQGAAS